LCGAANPLDRTLPFSGKPFHPKFICKSQFSDQSRDGDVKPSVYERPMWTCEWATERQAGGESEIKV
jgi:hypothetical protein